jgi:predicted metalloprotease
LVRRNETEGRLMRWRGRRQSANVEDRRRMGGRGMALGGGAGTLIIIIIVMLLGGDPTALLQNQANVSGPQVSRTPAGNEPVDDEAGAFVATVLADTEDVWGKLFRDSGRQYRQPKLVLFRGQTRSACGGVAQAAVGPHYCPADTKVYIDLSFFDELSRRFGAPGDFAQAYVIAHEIGHHVQNLLGATERVHRMKGRVSEAEYNQLSVRLELQADYYAGVWAHHAERMHGMLERGDLEEAIRAATAIGDDKLQMQSQGYVVPDSFTHGTSQQRVRWFRRGFESGDPAKGDTFGTDAL